MDKLIATMHEKMLERVEKLETELARVRAGRATPALLDGITVDYYGAETPIEQAATVAVPEARYLTITPWDKSMVSKIAKAIMTSDLGLHPSDDGKMIRIEIPAPTEEGRKELTKRIDHDGEEAKVSIRNIRRDAMDGIKRMEKNEGLGEDERRVGEKEVQEITDDTVNEIDKVVEAKRKELMEV